MLTCKQCGKQDDESETYCSRCGSGQLESDNIKKEKGVILRGADNERLIEKDKALEVRDSNNSDKINGIKDNTGEVRFKDWLILFLTLMIPFYNIYKIIVVAIGKDTINKSITNLMRVYLLWMAVVGVIPVTMAILALLNIVAG